MTLTERIAELARELARRNLVLGDVEPHDIEVTPWRIIIHLRPKPVILIDPCPTPRPPINRQGVNRP